MIKVRPSRLPAGRERFRLPVLCACILYCSLLASCDNAPTTSEASGVLGLEPVPRVVQCTDPYEILLDLTERDRRNITIVHVSSKPDLEPVPEEQLGELRRALKRKDRISPRTAQGVTGNADYLFAASRLGLIREIFWIIPGRLLEYSDAERRVRMFLSSEAWGFDSDEVAAMRYKSGCVTGMLAGVPVHVCGVETLPAASGTVTIDLDTAFFPEYASERQLTVLEAMKDFVEKMARRRISVTDAIIRRMHEDGTPSPLYQPVADHLSAILQRPTLVSQPPPELWVLQHMAATLLATGEAREAATLLNDARRRYPDDASLAMLGGTAAALTGNTRTGLEVLSALCEQNAEHCYALVYAGKALLKKGRTDDAARYLARAQERHPGPSGKPVHR